AERVVADRPDARRPPTRASGGDEGRANLAPGLAREPLQTLLAAADRVFGDDRQQVEAVFAQTDEIERPRAGRGEAKGNPHRAAHTTSFRRSTAVRLSRMLDLRLSFAYIDDYAATHQTPA